MSKKKVVIAVIVCIVLVMFLSPPIEQYLLERKINSEFSNITLPSSLVSNGSSDFGDVLLGKRQDWGVQFNYTNSIGKQQELYESVAQALKDAGYNVQKMDGWVLHAQNSKVSMRVTGFDKITIFSVRDN